MFGALSSSAELDPGLGGDDALGLFADRAKRDIVVQGPDDTLPTPAVTEVGAKCCLS